MRKFIALRLFHQDLDITNIKILILIESIKCYFTKLGTIRPSIESIRSLREVGLFLRYFPQCARASLFEKVLQNGGKTVQDKLCLSSIPHKVKQYLIVKNLQTYVRCTYFTVPLTPIAPSRLSEEIYQYTVKSLRVPGQVNVH